MVDELIRREVASFVASCDMLVHRGEMNAPLTERERELIARYIDRLCERLRLKTGQ